MRNKLTLTVLLTLALCSSAAAQSVNQTFQREVILQRIENGKVVQEYVRRSRFVRDDNGRPIEQVIYSTPKLKGVSDRELEDFAWGRPTKEHPGIQKLARDFDFQQFSSTVEIKDAWSAHWPKGSQVKVYFSADFNSDLPILIQALNAWNSLIPEVQFVYAGTAETTQVCEACLTVARKAARIKSFSFLRSRTVEGATLQTAERDNGTIAYGRMELARTDHNTMFSTFAHEIGHTLGLGHSDSGLMKDGLPKGKMVFPTQLEANLVRSIFR